FISVLPVKMGRHSELPWEHTSSRMRSSREAEMTLRVMKTRNPLTAPLRPGTALVGLQTTGRSRVGCKWKAGLLSCEGGQGGSGCNLFFNNCESFGMSGYVLITWWQGLA